jgi:ankyrin repeat protein
VQSFFNDDGTLRSNAGKIDWPFGEPQKSNLDSAIKRELQTKVDNWTNDAKDIIDNAFIYACMGNHSDVAKFLLAHGAELNVIPKGFDFAGTGLHYAALRGHRAMVDLLLERGADPNVKDTKVGSTPSGWAAYGGHSELSNHLNNL